METLNELDRSHLDAIPILLRVLIESKESCKDISWEVASQVLRDWDKARVPTATGKDLDILANIPVSRLGMTDAELREKIKNRFLDE